MNCIKLLMFGCVITWGATAGEVSASLELSEVKVDNTEIDNGFLEAWGIDKTEYRRFLYLKSNTPRGVMTPTANPLYYLGLEARNAAERRKYAEKLAQLEFENWLKMEALNKEVLLASTRLYGAGDAVDLSKGDALRAQIMQIGNSYSASASALLGEYQGRDLFVDVDCESCISEFKKLMQELTDGDIDTIDIIFPKDAEDDQMKHWAYRAGVSRDLNAQQVINLRRAKDEEKVEVYPTVRSSIL